MAAKLIWITVVTTVFFFMVAACFAQPATELSIYNFAGLVSGAGGKPFASLVADQQGNFYGTTYQGGTGACTDRTGKVIGCGTVFELTLSGSEWIVSKQYSFQGGLEGQQPQGPVTLDAHGNVYGMTLAGGGLGGCYVEGVYVGCGTVFRLTPNAGGGWAKALLHAFDGNDGAFPFGGLTFDKAGNLFGTTSSGGLFQGGNVFEMSHAQSGWLFIPVYDFGTNVNDGNYPIVGVIVDRHGNLYGTTTYGGRPTCYCGIAFELSPTGTGWKEIILHSFAGGLADGAFPYAPLIFGAPGTLYGTADSGGYQGCIAYGCGTVFSLSRSSGGWVETQLHHFTGGSQDGGLPNGLVLDGTGNIYGTTFVGGASGNGTVFKLSTDGSWNILYSFAGGSVDGSKPVAGLAFDNAGNLYGTTSQGGTYGLGTVFQLTP